jgi:hypothetical protein
MLQAALGYAAAPLPWLSVGTRVQLVWMPTSPLFRVQTAVRPSLAVALGRWRLGTDLLVNVDEPFGFTGMGQRVWGFHLDLGVLL